MVWHLLRPLQSSRWHRPVGAHLWIVTLQWRHDECDGVSNHPPQDCSLSRLFRHRSKLRVTGLCAGNSPVTGEFPAQRASNAENVSILMKSSWLDAIHTIHSKNRVRSSRFFCVLLCPGNDTAVFYHCFVALCKTSKLYFVNTSRPDHLTLVKREQPHLTIQ